MGAGLKRRRPTRDSATEALAAITQAQFMLGVYAEILAMDQTIVERVRQLLISRSGDVDLEAHMNNLRLVLGQLDRVSERIAFWNGRVRTLVEGLSR